MLAGRKMYAKEKAITKPTKRKTKNDKALPCSLSKVRRVKPMSVFASSYLIVLYIKGMQAITVSKTITMLASSLKTQTAKNKAMEAYIMPTKRRFHGCFSAPIGVERDSKTIWVL